MTLIKIHVQIHNYFFLNENSIVKMFNTQNVVSTFVLVNQASHLLQYIWTLCVKFKTKYSNYGM
jgi:hypothetical protein